MPPYYNMSYKICSTDWIYTAIRLQTIEVLSEVLLLSVSKYFQYRLS